ncbi:MAG: hypothetical protein Q8Q38_01745 [bacterium]|nr:hypothetical protein [bacterium]
MTDKHDVLKQLFTDDNDVNAEELYGLLSPFIKINQKSKNIIFLDPAIKHSLKNKIVLFLLAKKVLFLLGELETDRVRSTDIIKETGIPKGSVNPTLKLLKEAKGNSLVTTDKDGYYITSYQVSKIKTKNILNNYEKDN